MQPRRWLFGLRWAWLACIVGLHASAAQVLSLPMPVEYAEDYFGYRWLFRDSLLVAQWNLLGLWAVLGPGRWYLRWPVIGGLVYLELNSWVVNNQARPEVVHSQLWWLLAVVVAGSVALFAARGWRLIFVPTGPQGRATRLHFSVLALLVLTAAVAGLVKLVMVLRQWSSAAGNFDNDAEYYEYLALAVPLAAAALGAVWASLKPGVPIWRILLLAVAAPVPAVLALLALNVDWNGKGFVYLALLATGIIVVTLLGVRAMGYRLVRGESWWMVTRKRFWPAQHVSATSVRIEPAAG